MKKTKNIKKQTLPEQKITHKHPKKNVTTTDKLRENPWMISTFALGLLVMILLVSSIVEDLTPNTIIPMNDSLVNNTSKANMLTPQEICPQIRVVPSWINENEVIEGYTNFNNETPSKIVDSLILNKIYFVYSSTCSVCTKQKELFGNEFQRYVDSGYTIKCG